MIKDETPLPILVIPTANALRIHDACGVVHEKPMDRRGYLFLIDSCLKILIETKDEQP